jgi:hypothetical protein
MAPPLLSTPKLFTPSDLKADLRITESITRLANDAFLRPKRSEPERWDLTVLRFPTHESYFAMLDENSIVALIFDNAAEHVEATQANSGLHINGTTKHAGSKVVACAAAVPWRGGMAREGAGTESGWEIKAVCVDGDEKYLRQGLTIKLLASLEEHLVQRAKAQDQLVDANATTGRDGKTLTLWILAAECLNGVYWRKRKFVEVRRSWGTDGAWGSKVDFEIVVFKKEVQYS